MQVSWLSAAKTSALNCQASKFITPHVKRADSIATYNSPGEPQRAGKAPLKTGDSSTTFIECSLNPAAPAPDKTPVHTMPLNSAVLPAKSTVCASVLNKPSADPPAASTQDAHPNALSDPPANPPAAVVKQPLPRREQPKRSAAPVLGSYDPSRHLPSCLDPRSCLGCKKTTREILDEVLGPDSGTPDPDISSGSTSEENDDEETETESEEMDAESQEADHPNKSKKALLEQIKQHNNRTVCMVALGKERANQVRALLYILFSNWLLSRCYARMIIRSFSTGQGPQAGAWGSEVKPNPACSVRNVKEPTCGKETRIF